ncbi:MAG: hypothetical protein AAFV33_20450 [Chloroflexota bacterium]
MADRTTIQKDIEQRMRDVQSQIEQLNQKIEQSGEEASKELQRSLDDLHARNQKAEEQLRELSKAGDDVLKTLATDIETYWNAFAGAVDNVFVSGSGNTSTEKTTIKVEASDADDVHESPDGPTNS